MGLPILSLLGVRRLTTGETADRSLGILTMRAHRAAPGLELALARSLAQVRMELGLGLVLRAALAQELDRAQATVLVLALATVPGAVRDRSRARLVMVPGMRALARTDRLVMMAVLGMVRPVAIPRALL